MNSNNDINQFDIPVLFLIFNRLDCTKKVFERIRTLKPKNLYIASDGPRNETEKETVELVRNEIISMIDWDCKVRKLFREENLGCKLAVSGAIDWLFENEEKGIILEDDCLPSQSFFRYCKELLERYELNERVMHIGGGCFLDNVKIEEDYFFTKYDMITGWATWRRAWRKYSDSEENFQDKFSGFEHIFLTNEERNYWYKLFVNYFKNKINSWGYAWTYSIWNNDGLAIYPRVNLVRHIGFGPDATHTKFYEKKLDRVEKELIIVKHPVYVGVNREMEIENFNNIFRVDNIVVRVFRLIYRTSIVLLRTFGLK